MFKKFFLLGLLTGIIGFASNAQYSSELGFTSDNDAYLVFLGDEYYTNGLDIFYRRKLDTTSVVPKMLSIRVGQNMYTPFSVVLPDPERHDRPFAGYLYGSAELTLGLSEESVLMGGLEAGVIGPASLAEDAQVLLHDILPFADPEGWEFQVQNEFGGAFYGSYLRSFSKKENNREELIGEAKLNAGTQFTNASIAAIFRTGELKSLNNSVYTKLKKDRSRENFWFIKPQLSAVVYDASIQGGRSNNDDPVTFEAKPLVFSVETGLYHSIKHWNMKFSFTQRSKEVESNAKGHQYASIGFGYAFK